MTIDPRIQAALDAPLVKAPSIAAFKPKKGGERWQRYGYAAMPGSGQKGESCGTCAALYFNENHRGHKFYKCRRSKKQGHHAGADIAKRSPACSLWSKKEI